MILDLEKMCRESRVPSRPSRSVLKWHRVTWPRHIRGSSAVGVGMPPAAEPFARAAFHQLFSIVFFLFQDPVQDASLCLVLLSS